MAAKICYLQMYGFYLATLYKLFQMGVEEMGWCRDICEREIVGKCC